MDADYIHNCVSSQDLWRYPNDKHNLIIRKPDIFYVDDPQLEIIYGNLSFRSGESYALGRLAPFPDRWIKIMPGNLWSNYGAQLEIINFSSKNKAITVKCRRENAHWALGEESYLVPYQFFATWEWVQDGKEPMKTSQNDPWAVGPEGQTQGFLDGHSGLEFL